jgi:hypothetical protein
MNLDYFAPFKWHLVTMKKSFKQVTIAAFVVTFGGVAIASVRTPVSSPSLTDCGTSGASCKLQSDCCSGYGCDVGGHCRKSGSVE